VSEVWEGAAELVFFDAPAEEHMLLAPQRIARGYRFTFAYTVDDLETLKELTETGEGALQR
jgi:acetoacetate decarboxylase